MDVGATVQGQLLKVKAVVPGTDNVVELGLDKAAAAAERR